MNTCKDCKYWERWPDEANDKTAGRCLELGDNVENGKHQGSDIRVYDDSLPITTEEDFGCIHWEEKK